MALLVYNFLVCWDAPWHPCNGIKHPQTADAQHHPQKDCQGVQDKIAAGLTLLNKCNVQGHLPITGWHSIKPAKMTLTLD